ncbi:MAG: type II secretion system minor pseudopilin GspI [Arenicella sp.]
MSQNALNNPAFKNNQGFTLLEVIIAIAIVSIAVISVFNAAGRSVDATTGADNRLVANWIAANALAEARLKTVDGQLALTNESIEMGGRQWRYEMEATDSSNPSVALVDVRVFIGNEQSSIVVLSGYISRL